MSYQGGARPGDNGYDPRYGPPSYYPPPPVQPFAGDNGYGVTGNPAISMQQMQYIHPMQAQNHGDYYQQAQYLPENYHLPPEGYNQSRTSSSQQHFPQFVRFQELERTPQYPTTASIHQYHGSIAQSPQHIVQHSLSPPARPSQTPQVQSAHPTKAKAPPKVITHTSHKLTQSSALGADWKLLVALAEEYFTAGQILAARTTGNVDEVSQEQYQRLIATGLGCLESCLQNCTIPPRAEAKIRLRLASVMIDETENPMETEMALTKGIQLCGQHHFVDLRYNMQFLLAKSMFKTGPKAAFKALDDNISESVAYKHFSWAYAFQFLRASLSLASSSASELNNAIHHLRGISGLANARNDRAIFMMASLMEATVHLNSSSAESRENLRRALAAAWTYQLDQTCMMPQIVCLIHFIDVTSTFLYEGLDQAIPKVQAMQTMMEQHKDDLGWTEGIDVAGIPITHDPNQGKLVSRSTRGFLDSIDAGRDMLIMSVLSRNDALAFSCLLSAIVLLHKDCDSPHRSSTYLQRAIVNLKTSKSNTSATGLPALKECMNWRLRLLSYCYVYQIFCFAMRTEWRAAKDALQKLNASMREIDCAEEAELEVLSIYLSGICLQGTGELDLALKVYQNPIFRLGTMQRSSSLSRDQFKHDISLLAALNVILIMQELSRKVPSHTSELISELEPFCPRHPNQEIRCAFDVIKSTVDTDPPTSLLKAKNHLRAALQASQSAGNQQLTCVILNIMCSKYFSGVVGTQAEKSAKVGAKQAERVGNLLWQSVGNGLYAKTLETQGKRDAAQFAMSEAKRFAAVALTGLP